MPTLVVLTLILVQEMRGVWLLISHASHLFLCYIPPVIIAWPVAWTGLLLILAMVVHRPYHVNIEREI
jgi:hypothetical protein